jgi:predicted PurR-regulated permease PerM
VVVIGIVGDAILFGPAGMFLAIPTITVVKVLVASSAKNLKAYRLVGRDHSSDLDQSYRAMVATSKHRMVEDSYI